MKAKFTKTLFSIVIILCFMLKSNTSSAQWTFNTIGNNFWIYPDSDYLRTNTNGRISVTYSGERLNSSVVPEGIVLKGIDPAYSSNNSITYEAIDQGIINAFNIPIEKWFKAKVGVNQTIQIQYQYNKFNNIAGRPQQVNSFSNQSYFTSSMIVGSQEPGVLYQNAHVVTNTETINAGVVSGTFSSTFNFPKGTTKGYMIIPIQEIVSNYFYINDGFNAYWVDGYLDNIIILPFVVEGPMVDMSSANPVSILGRFKEPAIPQMILHNPPGDNSTVTFQTNQEACRSMSQSLTTEESNAAKLNVTLGIAGSAGLFVTTNFEFSVTASVGGGGGSTAMKSSGKQNCVSILNAITTASGAAPANEGSLYIGYSSEIAYGVFPNVIINTSPSITVKKDTSIIFGVVPNSASPFYYTKSQILSDIAQKQSIINNPATLPKVRSEAKNQINVWKQVLAKDSINVNNPNAEVITNTFLLPELATTANSVTQSISSSETYDISHFLELSAGASFVINVGGSGVDGGYEFKTKKTMGASVSNTTNTSTTIAYSLSDDDPGDRIAVKIIRDKTYGTPIFKLDSAQSRTSWPYEGGYPRDQPSLRFSAAPASSSYTVPNVPVGQPSIFSMNICNNSNEPRTYNLRFNPQSNANGANIAITGTSGNTEYGAFTINANACNSNNFIANVTQGNAAALSSPDLNLQLYPINDQARASDIFATSNWGDYTLPMGVSTGQVSICQEANTSVPLTANCAPSSIATWYNALDSSVPIGTGSPFSQSPTINTNYFVSCNSGIYNYKKIPANAVIVNPKPTAPMLTASGRLIFCSPGSVTLNSYLGTNNNVMYFTKANSQYITVPHSPSINLAGTFTMEAWVNYWGVKSTILDKGNYNFLWQLNVNGNDRKMGFYNRGTGVWVYSTGIVPENTWTHVAITLNAGTLTFYINGVASGTAAVTFSQDNKPMNIGREQPCACNHFEGSMDELRLWNVLRTPTQIQANMNSGVAANSAGLVAYYKFNENSANVTFDETANSNNGTLTNGPSRQMVQNVPFNEAIALWTPSNTNVSSITASNSGTYTASLTNSFGCTNSSSLVVNALAPSIPTPQTEAYIPTGGSISLTATGCSGSVGNYSLFWYKASDRTVAPMPVSPTTTTNYYAKCRQSLSIFTPTTGLTVSCESLASANVTVNVGNYINSIISGNWENTNTWTPSRVPLPTDIVIINNHTVTITSDAANAKSLEYKSGATLKYLNTAAKLKVGF